MTTSSTRKTYPARRYEKGKCLVQYRSMNHNCHLASLQMVEEAVGLDAWESVKTSSVGVIVRLKEMDYTWSSQVVHHLLTNQLIEGQPIRYSLYEFGEITCLNCKPFDINSKVEVDHKAFWKEIGVSPSHGPMLSELHQLFPHIRNWSFEKKRMIRLLCVLSIGILGIFPSSRISSEEAKRVLDAEAFDIYPGLGDGCGSRLNSGGDDGFRRDLMEAVNTLTAKVGSMDTVVAEKALIALDIDAKVNARVGEAELVLGKKTSSLEEEIAKLREQMQAIVPNNDAHFVNQKDKVNINDLVAEKNK
ncbi:hypothetical protein N665_1545s0009 [Sinapis alba]|nr:hypothetical protein N665_1545s0009 [Sinapis alba]